MQIDGKPYFVGKDVAIILRYSDSSNAVSKNVDNDDKTTLLLEQDGSNYKSRTTLINESGLYSLILGSKLPTAKKIKTWLILLEVAINFEGALNNKNPESPKQHSRFTKS